ncbi:MAG: hypothetical protein HGA85_01340 [Nanoarchaeota archaeon]|nr:hypothetical protein [Nanoarchaeota archaeon]
MQRLYVSKILDNSLEAQNLEKEARVVVNNAIMNGNDIDGALVEFSESYSEYLDAKAYDAGFAIFYRYEGNTHILNFFEEELNLSGTALAPGSVTSLLTESEFGIDHEDEVYTINLTAAEMAVLLIENEN